MAVVYPLQALGDILIFIINESESGMLYTATASIDPSSSIINMNDSPSSNIDGNIQLLAPSTVLSSSVTESRRSKRSNAYSTLNTSSHSNIGEDDMDDIIDEIEEKGIEREDREGEGEKGEGEEEEKEKEEEQNEASATDDAN